jgi:flagellin
MSLQSTFQKLSSGFRINSASDDAAGLGISKGMEAQVRSFSVAERNANDAISMSQTADGAAEQIHGILSRLRELAVQGSNGTLSSSDSTNLDTEFQAMTSEIDRISNVTKFNGTSLLSGTSTTVNFQVGINTTTDDSLAVVFGGVDSSTLGVSGLDVTNNTNSKTAIDAIDTAIQNLSTTREGWGSAMNRLSAAVANIQTTSTNMTASLSRIRDVDIASETASMARQQVLSQAGVSILGQANQSPQLALKLLG